MIYEIKFQQGQANVFAQSSETYQPMDQVIVTSGKSSFLGHVIKSIENQMETDFIIERPVTAEDESMVNELQSSSAQAKWQSRELVNQLGLEMKIIEATYNLEKTQLFLSFTAEHRVDFRELLKKMAETFHVRIELRQIGSRDAAKVQGGIGPCGRPLCCSTFLYEFPTVSIKMAKNQNLSFKQNKLNGLCGRLMCCLSYEDEFYRQAQKDFPDYGTMVETSLGIGKVIGMNILSLTVKIKLEDSITEFNLVEIGKA